jgi:hypothetical protein
MPEYVSPLDPRTAERTPLAERPDSLAGRTVVLLDITKNRGAEFLDRIEQHLRESGARTLRRSKEAFSRPASAEVIEEIALHGDLCVEGLGD